MLFLPPTPIYILIYVFIYSYICRRPWGRCRWAPRRRRRPYICILIYVFIYSYILSKEPLPVGFDPTWGIRGTKKQIRSLESVWPIL